MLSNNKKKIWETAKVVYLKNGTKCQETLKYFFSTRPSYHFHKTMPYMGVVVAFRPCYTDEETQLPKDFVAFTCTTLWWKNVKPIIKWGLKNDNRYKVK